MSEVPLQARGGRQTSARSCRWTARPESAPPRTISVLKSRYFHALSKSTSRDLKLKNSWAALPRCIGTHAKKNAHKKLKKNAHKKQNAHKKPP